MKPSDSRVCNGGIRRFALTAFAVPLRDSEDTPVLLSLLTAWTASGAELTRRVAPVASKEQEIYAPPHLPASASMQLGLYHVKRSACSRVRTPTCQQQVQGAV